MRLLLTILLGLIAASGLSQEPCELLQGEEPQDRSLVSYSSPDGFYSIGCVVHILYNEIYEGSNIADSITYEAIDELNADLEQVGSGVVLQAIEHHDIAEHLFGDIILSGGLCFPDSANIAIMSLFAEDYSWDTSQYLNIFVIPFSCQFNYGFAFLYPGENNYADGVWINYRAWGMQGEHLDYARDLNKTVTHEFGHYAGLYHVFQGVDYCGEAHDCFYAHDRVCDTAPTKVSFTCVNPACPPGWNSMQPWAAYQHNNHMDYYVDSCRTTFTAGQVERMRWYLTTAREEAVTILTCSNDVTGDNVVGVDDLLCVLSCYELNCCDVTGDNYTGTLDVLQILSQYGNNCNYLTE